MKVCTAQWKNINMQSLSEHNCEFYALGCDMILNYLTQCFVFHAHGFCQLKDGWSSF
jgi:hypothetical protein